MLFKTENKSHIISNWVFFIKFVKQRYNTEDEKEIEFLKWLDSIKAVSENDSANGVDSKTTKEENSSNKENTDKENWWNKDIDELREIYEEKFDKRVYYGWDKDQIIEKLDNQ